MAELLGQTTTNVDLDDIDADGEYEMDDVEYAQPPHAQPTPDVHGHATDAEGSDVDAEGEEVDDDDDDDDDAEPVGDVKIARRASVSEDEDDYDADDAVKESSDAKSSDSEDSTNADSEEENQWQASEDGEDDELVKSSNPNVCMSVSLRTPLQIPAACADTHPDTASRTRTTTPVQSLKSTSLAPCVGIMVSALRRGFGSMVPVADMLSLQHIGNAPVALTRLVPTTVCSRVMPKARLH